MAGPEQLTDAETNVIAIIYEHFTPGIIRTDVLRLVAALRAERQQLKAIRDAFGDPVSWPTQDEIAATREVLAAAVVVYPQEAAEVSGD